MDMVRQIAVATEEQSAATEQVTRSMEHISDIIKRSATATEEIKVSASDLARLASNLKDEASWFKIGPSPAPQPEQAPSRSFSPAIAAANAEPARGAAPPPAAPSPGGFSNRLIPWSSTLSVKVPELDEQHKILIGIINDMYDALKSGRGREAVDTILPRLVEYTKEHFAHEEAMMQKHKYPGYVDHKAKHVALTNKVLEYVHRMQEGRGTAAVEFMEFLKNWLVSHTQGVDRKYGPYLNRQIV
jgi:hemerythrin-like metal-binding protein